VAVAQAEEEAEAAEAGKQLVVTVGEVANRSEYQSPREKARYLRSRN
jgi:hypothetical protein